MFLIGYTPNYTALDARYDTQNLNIHSYHPRSVRRTRYLTPSRSHTTAIALSRLHLRHTTLTDAT